VRARDSLLALIGGFACGGSPTLVDVEVTASGGHEGEQCLQRDDESGDDVPRKCIQLIDARAVDVLFVIDDGSEAGSLQMRLADAMDELAADVAAMDPQPELRIAFTSSRDANESCKGEGGAGRFVMSSCRERPAAFVDAEGVDRFAELCLARCELDEIATSQPWLERIQDETNLAPGIAMADALRCASVLGVSGCPLPAPFEATKYAFLRSADDAGAESGFFRPEASKILVWVTSGAECSSGPAGAYAFDPEGPRTLWADPEVATPGLCWNAGVECTAPDADGLMICEAVDVDVDGMMSTPEGAVLQPAIELAEFLEDIAHQLHLDSPVAELRIFTITGTPADSRVGDAPTSAPADDATAASYGVQPTCMLGEDAMLPPVRLEALGEFAESHDFELEISSACKEDFAPALAGVTEAIEKSLVPACMPGCVADVDPEAPGLQVDCRLTVQVPTPPNGFEEFILVPCVPSASGDPTIPPGETACVQTRTGAAMHPRCIDEGWNLEFVILWDGPRPPGTSFGPSCKLSQDKDVDCPEL
jgi:hypothetical protein